MDDLIELTRAIRAARYPEADVVFLAGSHVRGEATATSDLDLVVVFRHLTNAYRESFRFEGRPVEAFVHDPDTLDYFFVEVDRPTGIPSLPRMVSEGIEVPESSELSRALKRSADAILALGPPPWGTSEIDRSRYMITTLVDDLREPRSRAEQLASATALYRALADHYLRRRNLWSAKDKAIPRRLMEIDESFAHELTSCFEDLFGICEPARVIALAESTLQADGGWLFEGYGVSAPGHWRRAPGPKIARSTDA